MCKNCWHSDYKGEEIDYCKLNIRVKCDGERKDCKCGKYQEAKYNESLINSKGIGL